jgi:hypothetical protein
MDGIASLFKKPKLYRIFLNSKGFNSIYGIEMVGSSTDNCNKRLLTMIRNNTGLREFNEVKILDSRSLK